MRKYILMNIEQSFANRFNSARNKNFSKYELQEYLINELNNNSVCSELA
jgi:hypothetical protein